MGKKEYLPDEILAVAAAVNCFAALWTSWAPWLHNKSWLSVYFPYEVGLKTRKRLSVPVATDYYFGAWALGERSVDEGEKCCRTLAVTASEET